MKINIIDNKDGWNNMENYIFKGKYASETIDRFEENIKKDDRVLKIPSEMTLKLFLSGLRQNNTDILDEIKDYDYICFENVDIDEDLILSSMCLNKPIYINANKVTKFNDNFKNSKILRAFKIVDCSENNIYPLEYLYRNIVKNDKIYIFSKNENYVDNIVHKLSDLKEIFTIDIDYKNIMYLLDLLTKDENMMNLSFIMLDNPMSEYIDNNDLNKRKYRKINQEEFDKVVDKLYKSDYPYIVCEKADRKLNSNGKNFELIIEILYQNIIKIY